MSLEPPRILLSQNGCKFKTGWILWATELLVCSHSIGHLHPRVHLSVFQFLISGTFFFLLNCVLCLFQKSFLVPSVFFVSHFCLLVILVLVGVDREKMSFSVKHPSVQIHLEAKRVQHALFEDNPFPIKHILSASLMSFQVFPEYIYDIFIPNIPRIY